MNGVVGLAVIGFIVWCLCSKGGGGKPVPGHFHGGNRRQVARHEAGHYVATKAVGGRVHSAELSDGNRPSGMVWSTLPNARADIVFLMAGRSAGGSGSGCAGDDQLIARTLREFPARDRGRIRRMCQAEADRIVASRGGEIRRIADRLDRNGHA